MTGNQKNYALETASKAKPHSEGGVRQRRKNRENGTQATGDRNN